MLKAGFLAVVLSFGWYMFSDRPNNHEGQLISVPELTDERIELLRGIARKVKEEQAGNDDLSSVDNSETVYKTDDLNTSLNSAFAKPQTTGLANNVWNQSANFRHSGTGRQSGDRWWGS